MQLRTHDGIDFELPASLELLIRDAENAGCYVCHCAAAESTATNQIQSPTRNPGVRWFDQARLESILQGFAERSELPPVEIHRHPKSSQLMVRNGFHRYYAAVAVKYTCIPCVEYDYFDITAA